MDGRIGTNWIGKESVLCPSSEQVGQEAEQMWRRGRVARIDEHTGASRRVSLACACRWQGVAWASIIAGRATIRVSMGKHF